MDRAVAYRGKRMDAEAVAFGNAVSRAAALEFPLGDRPHRLELFLEARGFEPETRLSVRIGPATSPLHVSGLNSAPALTNLLGGAVLAELPGDIQPIMLESAFRPAIEVLERALGTSVVLHQVAETPEGALSVWWALSSPESTSVRGQVLLNRAAAGMIRQALEKLPQAPGASVERLPMLARVVVGETRLTVAELRSLKTFDVLLMDPAGPFGEACLLVLSPRHRYPATLKNQTLSVTSLMSQPETPAPASTAAIPVEDLPVQLVFDVGSLEVTVGELRALNPGHTFELARSIERPVSIRANGQPVATGELVQIGDRVGVRLLEIRHDDESA